MMRKVVYDFAMTLDGYICRRDGTIEDFVPHGPHVDDYLERLQTYDTVLLGRRTYELGYKYGLVPGARAYPHMEHFVFSTTLTFGHDHQLNIVTEGAADVVRDLKSRPGSDIYLCGGSDLAGFLLQNELIDELVIKLNPIFLGDGLPLFGTPSQAHLHLLDSKPYANGVVLLRYDLSYG